MTASLMYELDFFVDKAGSWEGSWSWLNDL